ncbi:CHAT domain-containing protein [Coleofasciculus chthonoplastes]|uniref:CHAT domain-containing protein n=1 Tax=Coleofasciculus chthonoplastes TaxID=64178 RepID=UPI0032F7F685
MTDRSMPFMLTLRLTQQVENPPDSYRVDVVLDDKVTSQSTTIYFKLNINEQDQEKIRWYLEDFLEYPQIPAPTIAATIEQQMVAIGVELFEKLFQANDDTRQIWSQLRHRLNHTRVEIVTGVTDAAAIPWELIRNPDHNLPLVLQTGAFVRTHPNPQQPPQLPETDSSKMRILLVICRPQGGDDVPFRSVATQLIRGLTDSAREIFQLDVLRPPTFQRLEEVLRQAKAEGKPYHIVHFDGHGVYEDPYAKDSGKPANPKRMRGYLLFEKPDYQNNREPVHGKLIGQLLAETGVSLLVLNACRSAYTEAPTQPGKTLADNQTSAYGSLAQEVMKAGVVGVVAMRYKVYVVTAAEFVAKLYAALAQGQTLGEAVTPGRQQLYDQPLRAIAYEAQTLQDWLVPVVYETVPNAIRLTSPPASLLQGEGSLAYLSSRGLDGQLPKHPEAGFLGRDETLLGIDRAFDTQSIVLLHAYAGSGKTSTVAEFGRWYLLTGGVKGLVLFTSFERYLPLARVLDKMGQVFERQLEALGVHWLTLNDKQRRDLALQLLQQVPVLWIWDNVEPVAGFPTGTESAWSGVEQQELVDFLREAQQTKAKFLLTSRRDEQGWLGDLPHRITILPMPMRERVQLAKAVAEKYGHQLTEVEDWRPLLRYSHGNPMTITVVVGQALRNGLRSREQIEDFVLQLRFGEAEIDDDEHEGRSKSLAASLSYGFRNAFTEEERQQLALLYFFQGFVNVGALCLMGLPEAEWCVSTVRGLTFEAGIALLDRAAEVGMLIRLVENCYRIHPVLPWYFKKLFDQYYLSDEGNNPTLASHAYVEAIGVLANYSNNQYDGGNRDLVILLNLEEANLLYARKLAQTNSWWLALMKTVQGLRTLYEHTGRRLEWARLVEELVPHFVEPSTDGSLPGREEEWAIITEYRVELAREGQQWEEAERLHRARMEWACQQASSALAAPPETLNSIDCRTIRTLSCSLHELGQILREQGKSDCVTAYEKALALLERIGDKAAAAVCSLNLGHAYTQIPAIRNLHKAEQWYQRSLELRDQQDRLGCSKCFTELGRVAHERFQEAQTTSQPEEKLRHLNEALHYSAQALNLLPQNAVKDLAVAHNQIGNICRSAGDLNRAFWNYRETIRYEEAQGNLYGAANSRFNIALVLTQDSRFDEALLYAQAALCNFQIFGDRAAADIQDTKQLITLIEQSLKPRGG